MFSCKMKDCLSCVSLSFSPLVLYCCSAPLDEDSDNDGDDDEKDDDGENADGDDGAGVHFPVLTAGGVASLIIYK